MNHAPKPVESVGILDAAPPPPRESGPTAEPPTDESGGSGSLPSVRTPLTPARVIDLLARESKRGRLAGFKALGPGSASVTAFGGVYDHDLLIHARAASTPTGSTTVSCELHLQRKMPIIAVALFVFTIMPGLPITDSMLKIYFSWYTIETWWWYMPLVLLSAPLMWKQFRSGQREAQRDALATIEKIRGLMEKSAG